MFSKLQIKRLISKMVSKICYTRWFRIFTKESVIANTRIWYGKCKNCIAFQQDSFGSPIWPWVSYRLLMSSCNPSKHLLLKSLKVWKEDRAAHMNICEGPQAVPAAFTDDAGSTSGRRQVQWRTSSAEARCWVIMSDVGRELAGEDFYESLWI